MLTFYNVVAIVQACILEACPWRRSNRLKPTIQSTISACDGRHTNFFPWYFILVVVLRAVFKGRVRVYGCTVTDPLVGLGGGYPLPIPHTIDAFGASLYGVFGASNSTPSASRPFKLKVWLRSWLSLFHKHWLLSEMTSIRVLLKFGYCRSVSSVCQVYRDKMYEGLCDFHEKSIVKGVHSTHLNSTTLDCSIIYYAVALPMIKLHMVVVR